MSDIRKTEEIVEKARSGDRSAFDDLYRDYSEPLLKFVVKMGVPLQDAEDIVSDTFMEAIEHIGELRKTSAFSTWLHEIAKRKVYAINKEHKNHSEVSLSAYMDADPQNDELDILAMRAAQYNCDDTIMLPADYAENEEIKQIIAETVNALNDDQREAVYLFYHDGRSIKEIAELTGVSGNTVKTRLELARKYIKRKLRALQKNGVTLCAVPITAIIGVAVSQSKLSEAITVTGSAAVVSTGASGAGVAAVSTVATKVGVIAAAVIMVGGGIGAYAAVKNHKGSVKRDNGSYTYERNASSMIIPDSNEGWNPDLLKINNIETETPRITDDGSSVSEAETTDESSRQERAQPTPATQQQSAQPVQQTITYYDNVDEGDTEEEGGNGSGDGGTGEGANENTGDDNTGNDTIDTSAYFYNVQADGTASIYAFDQGKQLTDIVIPSEIDGHKITSIDYNAFSHCVDLTSIVIPESVTSIGYQAFYDCVSLTNITIPEGVTIIDDEAFRDCVSLTSITIPSSVTSIGTGAFRYCKSLKSVDIPDGVTCIYSYAFRKCTSLTSITIPDSVTSIGSYAFHLCESLDNISIPQSVKKIDDGAFSGCLNLTSITIPEGVKYISTAIFDGCNNLKNVNIPVGVTGIGENAFANCSSLTNITIPKSVTYIYKTAFDGCDILTIKCKKGSYADEYAKENNINVEYI